MITGYLKWDATVVGEIHNHTTVIFTNPALNHVTAVVTGGVSSWFQGQYVDFLQDRIVAKNRRDIEQILHRMNLVAYDAIRIAEITYAINPKDLFWVAPRKDMLLSEALNGTFENIFRMGLEESGNSVSTPDGQNIKSYAMSKGFYGINKKRLYPLATDAESEVAVYKLV